MSREAFEQFKEWLIKEMPPNTVIGNPDWWAKKIWQACEQHYLSRIAELEAYNDETCKIIWDIAIQSIKKITELEAKLTQAYVDLNNQSIKLAEAEKDAERYRWLKYQNADLENDTFVVLAHDADAENNWKKYWVGSDLDNAIDQAIESEKI